MARTAQHQEAKREIESIRGETTKLLKHERGDIAESKRMAPARKSGRSRTRSR